jgi:hypothetical protein
MLPLRSSDSGLELPLIVEDGISLADSDPIESSDTSTASTRIALLGGTVMMVGYAVFGAAVFFTDEAKTHFVLYGYLLLVAALLQTVGAMIVAASGSNIDLVAKRHPRCVFTFALSWIVLYKGLQALTPPITAVHQAFWIGTLPFMYLLLHFRAVVEMRGKVVFRFSDLFAYSLALDLIGYCIKNFLYTNNIERPNGFSTLPGDLVGTAFLISGLFVTALYWHLCSGDHSRSIALSVTIYAYLLTFGCCSLGYFLVKQYTYHEHVRFIDYANPIIHITIPLAYFALRPIIYRHLGHHWLKQRSRNAHSIAEEQGCTPLDGNVEAVQMALNTGTDLNAYQGNSGGDDFTLLILACVNGHKDAVDLLLSQEDLQVNKGSLVQNWTPLYVAAMRGENSIVEKLIMHRANVHVKTEDGQNALLAATTKGHAQITQQLMEAGARKDSKWMGVNVLESADGLGLVDIAVSLRSYQSHFQGNVLEQEGCKCVVSWPGIYAKSWDKVVAQSKQDEHSAAVVFLPKNTLHYGKCGSDKCYCIEMYGEKKGWGCRW